MADIDKDESITEGEDTQDEESEESEEEQTSDEEKTEEDKGEDKGEDSKESRTRRSTIAQKKHWRDKFRKSSAKVTELESDLEKLRGAVKKPADDKEAAAQEYIRNQARNVYEELQKVREKEEAQQLASFEEEVDSVLEDNPDVSEEELLDTIEELEVDPATALRIIKRQAKDQGKKPKMPKSKRASTQVKPTKPEDDKGKNIFQIAREEREKLKT